MMRRFYAQLILTLLCLGTIVPYSLAGDDLVAETLDLTVIPISFENIPELIEHRHPDMALSRAGIKRSKGTLISTSSELLPSLSAQHFAERVEGGQIFVQQQPVSVNRTTLYPRAFAQYEVQTGGQTIFRIVARKHLLKSSRLTYDQTFQETMLQVASEYLDILRDQALISQSELSKKEASKLVDYHQARMEEGFGMEYDVLQAKASLLDRENEYQRVLNQESLSKVTILASLNYPMYYAVVPQDAELKPLTFIVDTPELTEWEQEAEKNRSDLRRLTYEIKAAKAFYRSTFSQVMPTVSLSAYIGGVGPRLNSLRNTRQGGITISTDLLQNLGVNLIGSIYQAKGEVEQAIAEREKQRGVIKKALARAYYDFDYQKGRLAVLAEQVSVEEKTMQLAKDRVDAGVGISLEIVQQEARLANARIEYIQTVAEYNRTQLQLLFEAGRLTPDVLTSATAP